MKEEPKSLSSMCALHSSYINVATTRLMDLKIGYGEHISSLKIIEQRQIFTTFQYCNLYLLPCKANCYLCDLWLLERHQNVNPLSGYTS